MKYTKINNVRTGIAKKQSKESKKGFLYATGIDGNPVKDVRRTIKHVNECLNRARKLYANSVIFQDFSSLTEDKDLKEKYKKLVRKFSNSIMKPLVDIIQNDMPTYSGEDMRNWIKVNEESCKNLYGKCKRIIRHTEKYNVCDLSEDEIHLLVKSNLSGRLRAFSEEIDGRVVSVPDIVERILGRLAGKDLGLSEREEKLFLRAVYEDCTRYRFVPHIIASLCDKEVKVQAYKDKGGKYRLRLSNSEHKKKRAITEFLIRYASEDTDGQKKLCSDMKSLLLDFLGTGDFGGDEIFMPHEKYRVNLSAIIQLTSEKNEILKKYRFKKNDPQGQDKTNLDRINGELKRLQGENDELRGEVKKLIRGALVARYNDVKKGIAEEDMFWLGYFQDQTEKYFKRKHFDHADYLKCDVIFSDVWKTFRSLISEKLMEVGKGVYYFVMPQDSEEIKGLTGYGEVLEEYREGISSFDYELIHAKEAFSRALSMHLVFASNTFSRSVMEPSAFEKNEDFYLIPEEDLSNQLLSNARKKMLRFWGGISRYEGTTVMDMNAYEMVDEARKCMYMLRNDAFHFSTKLDTDKVSSTHLEKLIDSECSQYEYQIFQKYYANNLWMFYKQDDIRKLIGMLYSNKQRMMTQVPAFEHIFNKNSLLAHPDVIKTKKYIQAVSTEVTDYYRNAAFFLMKELYYKAFLPSQKSKDYFVGLLNEDERQINAESSMENLAAIRDFKNRLKPYIYDKESTLGEMCQFLTSQYNLYNTEDRVKTGKDQRMEKKYQHLLVLQYDYLRRAFIKWMSEPGCKEQKALIEAMRTPKYRKDMVVSEAEFCKPKGDRLLGRVTDEYKTLLIGSPVTLAWYLTGHFLSPVQINHLKGEFLKFMQCVGDIKKRADLTGNKLSINPEKEFKPYMDIVQTLDFVSAFCGKTSNKISDYYGPEPDIGLGADEYDAACEDEYASMLSHFVSLKKDGSSETLRNQLKAFCESSLKLDDSENPVMQKIGIYHDGTNAICNRNIILSDMYGSIHHFENIVTIVGEEDICGLYKKQKELEEVFKRGFCTTSDEQKKVKEYQNLKNRVELLDLKKLSELSSELYSRLVSWAQMRERDMLYEQLGYVYIKQFWSEDEKDSAVESPEGKLLYQFYAMYSYDLPLYYTERGKDEKTRKKGNFGAKYAYFVLYLANRAGEPCTLEEVRGLLKENSPKISAWLLPYSDSLRFFESEGSHEEMIKFRNGIDHFHYFQKADMSLSEMYSYMFTWFMDYSANYKKNVPVAFENILKRNKLIPRISIEPTDEIRLFADSTAKNHNLKLITLKNLSSDTLSFKLFSKDASQNAQQRKLDKVTVNAVDDNYLEEVRNLIKFKEG